MYKLLESHFFYSYWHYFLSGFLTFICARFLYYWFITRNEQQSSFRRLKLKFNKPTIGITDDFGTEPAQNVPDSYAIVHEAELVPFHFEKLHVEEMLSRSETYYQIMSTRRTIRFFSDKTFPIEVVYNIIKTAGTSPSGAHMQPWTYIIIRSLELKRTIRAVIEREEELNYKRRMGETWTSDIKRLGTSWVKEYLTEAPYIILVFKQVHGFRENGKKQEHYYNEMSVSLAAGFLVSAIHYAGLATVTSTPLNCGPFIRTILGRPSNEKLILLFPIGYAANDCKVPNLKRKHFKEICLEM